MTFWFFDREHLSRGPNKVKEREVFLRIAKNVNIQKDHTKGQLISKYPLYTTNWMILF
jgi:hypothetical protein